MVVDDRGYAFESMAEMYALHWMPDWATSFIVCIQKSTLPAILRESSLRID